jgi:exonuclease III
MKILSWNCRGLGKPSAVRDLRQLIKTHQPDLIFLSETKLQKSDFLETNLLVTPFLILLLIVLSVLEIEVGV